MPNFISCLLLLLGLTLAVPVQAQTAGQSGIVVSEASGVVRYRIGDSAPVVVGKGQVIPIGARITTGNNAGVVLTFPDGMVVSLGEQSRLRVLDFRFVASDVEKSRVVLNLTDGGVRITMGAIGQRDPGLIQLQVGEGSLSQALERPRSGEINLTVRGIATLVQIAQGRVSLLVGGNTFNLANGQSALIHEGGSVQMGGAAQLADVADRTDDGRTMQGRLERMLGAPSGRPGQTVITLSTPPGFDAEEDQPRATALPTTAATGAGGGGGNPRAASPN